MYMYTAIYAVMNTVFSNVVITNMTSQHLFSKIF